VFQALIQYVLFIEVHVFSLPKGEAGVRQTNSSNKKIGKSHAEIPSRLNFTKKDLQDLPTPDHGKRKQVYGTCQYV
jgi:hypothetical protein